MSTPATVPYATLASVTSTSWSLMLDSTAGKGPGSGIGQIVQSLDDVHQCLQIIFSTVPGEDPSRPTFGCDLTAYLDLPLPAATPAIVAAVSTAIQTWEPRATLISVTVNQDLTEIGHLVVDVVWQPNTGLFNNTSSALGSGPQSTTLVLGGVSSL